MSVTAAIAVYFLLWWMVLFAVLAACAQGGRAECGQNRRRWNGNHLTLKFVVTTLIAATLFAVGTGVYLQGPAFLRSLGGMLGARI